MSYEKYPYLVLDTRSNRFRSEPVVGYFLTKRAAEDNATARNSQINDPYGMKRYIVMCINEVHGEWAGPIPVQEDQYG